MKNVGIAAIATVILVTAPVAMADRGGRSERNNRRHSADAGEIARVFDSLDRNGDRLISRQEWPAEERTFERLDANDDGFLTRQEASVWSDSRQRDGRPHEDFASLDRDRNGVITRNEWPAGRGSFERLDQNRDNRLTPSELRRRNDSRDDRFERRDRNGRGNDGFQQFDRDRNGRITQNEWPGDARSFRKRDRNRDGFISVQEFGRNNRGDDDDDDNDDLDNDDN